MCLMLKSPICIKYMYIYIAPVDLEEGGGGSHTPGIYKIMRKERVFISVR